MTHSQQNIKLSILKVI